MDKWVVEFRNKYVNTVTRCSVVREHSSFIDCLVRGRCNELFLAYSGWEFLV